ncbi:MAG TPA: HD domain-containing phosphohydrolase [Blastocatellia bacterium]|nr:HD domain-containing phosphohydrolase [Blastocatellia bacterium]
MSSNDIAILIVDDEEPIRKLLAKCLSLHYTCETAASADEAVEKLSERSFNLVLADIAMPGATGLELCQFIHQTSPRTVVVMVSGKTDIEYAVQAMRQGAFDYLCKPFDLAQVTIAVDRALRYQALLEAQHQYEQSREEAIREKTHEFRLVNESLNQTLEVLYRHYRETLRVLAGALEARDIETKGHSERVVAYSLRLGRELGLSHKDMIALEQGALLHDIGKIGVPDAILRKRGSLTEEEWVHMRQHIDHGLRIISDIDFLSGARPVVGQHHEKYDGSGYPQQLRGEEIHLHARIFAVADAFDAMTSDRPYRQARSYGEARAEIVAHANKHFDPRVVNAFLKIAESEWAEIRASVKAGSYSEQCIDKREIRSFIVSLKRPTGTTGPLTLPVM